MKGNINYLKMNNNPRISGHLDLQGIEAITNHIDELCKDFLKTRNPLIIKLIREWQDKRRIKQQEIYERCN